MVHQWNNNEEFLSGRQKWLFMSLRGKHYFSNSCHLFLCRENIEITLELESAIDGWELILTMCVLHKILMSSVFFRRWWFLTIWSLCFFSRDLVKFSIQAHEIMFFCILRDCPLLPERFYSGWIDLWKQELTYLAWNMPVLLSMTYHQL